MIIISPGPTNRTCFAYRRHRTATLGITVFLLLPKDARSRRKARQAFFCFSRFSLRLPKMRSSLYSKEGVHDDEQSTRFLFI